MSQALTCLWEFHKRDIIHRDIKPSNILITEEGVQFPDLGLVCDASRSTLTATVAGSPDYVAPEQIFKKPVPASDIYSLGFVMQFVMTGEQPNIPFDHLLDVDHEDFDFTSLMQRGYSQNFVGIIEKMCQKNVQRRYATVDDILHDVDIGHVTMPLVKPDKRTLTKQMAEYIVLYTHNLWDRVTKIGKSLPYKQIGHSRYGFQLALWKNKALNTKGLQIAPWKNEAEDAHYGVQLGVLNVATYSHGLQAGIFNGVDAFIFNQDSSYGAQIGIVNHADDVRGAQFGMGFNSAKETHGLQLAGLLNGTDNAYGVQFAVGVNLADNAYGVQLAGGLNGANHAYGLQLAGFGNVADHDMHGVQLASIVSGADNVYGLQAGGVATICPEELVGVQIAPICYANHGKYLQFGLLTIRGNQGYKSLIPLTGWSPLIGWRWEKKS